MLKMTTQERVAQPGSPSQCIDIAYDDAHCAPGNKCCVGVHDHGLQRQCLNQVRACRKLGNVWDPPRPLHPLPGEYLYTAAPGYATTGAYVEHFGNWGAMFNTECILKNALFGFLFTVFLFVYSGRDLDVQEIAGISIVASVLKCVLATL